MKTCSKCKKEKELIEFSRKYDSYQSECKACRSAYTRQHYLKNKTSYVARAAARNVSDRAKMQAFLDSIKNTPCLDCKHSFPAECMDFDHVRGSKVGNVSKLASWNNLEKVKQEIAKCEVVCANCHRIRTANRRKLNNGG